MAKYLAVYHRWWMGSKGFKTEVLDAPSKKCAWALAEAKCHRESHTFERWACWVGSIVEIGEMLSENE